MKVTTQCAVQLYKVFINYTCVHICALSTTIPQHHLPFFFYTCIYSPPSLTYLPSPTFSCSSRGDQLEKLRSGKVYDVLVIGGGATGCGIALDSVLRGVCILYTVHGLSPSPSSSPTPSPFPSLSLRPSFPPSLPPSLHLSFNPCVKSTCMQYSGA